MPKKQKSCHSTVETLESMVLMSAAAADIDLADLEVSTDGVDLVFGIAKAGDIDGGDGNDTLIGASGENFLTGGEGDDFLIPLRGDNIVDGGNGQDVAVYLNGLRSDYNVTDVGFGDIIEVSNGGNSDLLFSIESVRFQDGTFAISELVSTNPESIEAAPTTTSSELTAEALVSGSDDSDLLAATSVGESLDGQGGNDVLVAAAGNNSLLGGEGNDSFFTARGNNKIDGGSGEDSVFYLDGNRADYTLTDFGSGDIQVENNRIFDFLSNVETLVFRDGSVSTDAITFDAVFEPPEIAEEPPIVIEEPPVVDEEPPVVIEEPPEVAEEPPVVVEEPPVVAEEPPVVVEEPPVVDEEPPVVIEEPPVVAEEPPIVIEEPPVDVEEPPVVVEEPPVDVEEPPVETEEPPVVAEEPPVVIEEPPVVDDSTLEELLSAVDDTSVEQQTVVVSDSSPADSSLNAAYIADTWIAGTAADDNITGTDGNDEIYVPLGTNTIDGGDGEDTLVIYEGARTDFTVSRMANGDVVIEGPGLNGQIVKQTMTNVERILFNDQILETSSIPLPSPEETDAGSPGSDSSEWISGSEGDDQINAGGGDDEIYAPIGNNEIDGGDGDDALVVYEGIRADYQLMRTMDGKIYMEGPGLNGQPVKNLLTNIERIVFNDQVVITADLTLAGNNDPLSSGDAI